MSERKALYGKASSEPGRQKWDEDQVRQQARERADRERQARESRFQRAPTPPDAREVEIRQQRLNLDQDLNKITLIPAGASAVGRKGRGAGYYCDACDLTYKDSLQWIDHLNSKQHLRATGQTETLQRATLSDVRGRLAWLRQKREDEKVGQMYDIRKRVEERHKLEEEERKIRREKRMQKRKLKKAAQNQESEDDDPDKDSIAQMMGIKAFGSTKVS
ncbi:uncharacterized protein V1516DRAFT_679291 [Lipomyces oligophaga]|uniref:uncharacterized protein n=1 Tax=Lipomyces oligophaga TaxID=45792 RepID=UPI0034CD41E2